MTRQEKMSLNCTKKRELTNIKDSNTGKNCLENVTEYPLERGRGCQEQVRKISISNSGE